MKSLSTRLSIRPAIILLSLVVLVSAHSLKNPFFSGDDEVLIVDNPRIDLPIKELPSIFTNTLPAPNGGQSLFYRPVLQLLYSINYKIWGPNPVGFHFINIMFHWLCAIFVYKIGIILFKGKKLISLIGASLFAVHPVNNEPLFRAPLNENIYGLFMIVSVYFFIRERRYLSLLTFAFALLSKESAVMLPFALCILSIHERGFKKGIASMSPYVGIMAIYFIIRLNVADSFWGYSIPQPLPARIFTMAAALFDYVRLLIIPYPLHPFYTARLYTSLLQPKVLAGMATLTVFFFLALKLRKDKAMIFLMSSPFILLVPVIAKVNTFPLGWLDRLYIAERFLYVPAMAFSLFISAFSFSLAGEGAKKYLLVGWTAVVIVFSGITFSTGKTWESDATPLERITADAPDSALAHCHRGDVLFMQGRLNEAINEYEAAFYPDPSFYEGVKLQYDKSGGKILAGEGKTFNAGYLTNYLPTFAVVHFALGRVYLVQGDLDRAIRKFRVALILKPGLHGARHYLAEAYMKNGQYDRAGEEFHLIMRRNR